MKKQPSLKSANRSKPTKTEVPAQASSSGQIGRILKRWRDLKKLTQADAALNLGISRTTLAGWEQSRRSPVLDDQTLPGLLRIFGDLGLIAQESELPKGRTIDEVGEEIILSVREIVAKAKRIDS